MSVAPAGVSNVLVAVSGVLQDPSTYSVVGNTLTFTAAPPSGTGNISCRYLGVPASGVTTTAYRTVTEFTATASQTTFTPPSYTVGFINVYLNGVLLGSADYTATNGTTVVLATGASAGNLLTVESFLVSSVLNAIPNTSGSVSASNLAATGTPSSSTYLRGDMAWASVASSQWTTTGSDIYYNTGNVGVGTSSPGAKVDVKSANNTGTDPIIRAISNNGTASTWLTFNGVSVSSGNACVFHNGTTEQMRITSTGQVNLTRPTGDDTEIVFLRMQGGGTSGNATDNLAFLSKYTTTVSTSTKAIYGGPLRGCIVVVTGYTGASYFSDILNCSSNSVTVISSQNSTGSPASRTYSITSFLLSLAMGSDTYNVATLLLGTQPRY
jgi:hypothetical protein